MNEKESNEIQGRLWLWTISIDRTRHFLDLAFRARRGADQEFQKKEFEEYNEKLQEFTKKLSDPNAGSISSSHRRSFDASIQRPFPTLNECMSIYDACIELAIVHFCQVFNAGYPSNGQTSSNNKEFIKKHFDKIIEKTFFSEEERKKFDELKEQILTSRDKLIAHTDGDSYSITHGSLVSKLSQSRSWRNIDIEFWHSFLDKMYEETHNYKMRLKYVE